MDSLLHFVLFLASVGLFGADVDGDSVDLVQHFPSTTHHLHETRPESKLGGKHHRNKHKTIISDATNETRAYHVSTTLDSLLTDYQLDEKSWNATRACWKQFLVIPREIRELLDEPGMACLEGLQTTSDLKRHDVETKFTLPTFPRTHVEVPQDTVKRMHVFSVGPESSGTTFVAQFASAALGLDFGPAYKQSDRVSGEAAALWHISFPEGSTCEGCSTEPILDDAGVGQDLLGTYTRFYVDIASVVAKYKARGEKVAFLQVVRNPTVSLRAKMNHAHCKEASTAQTEQTQAFQLMQAAMGVPEVATVCYEEMLAGGADYLIKKLQTVGITPQITLNLPAVSTASSPPGSCGSDMAAYAQLCPNSPAVKACQQTISQLGEDLFGLSAGQRTT